MNPLTQIKRIQSLNAKESDLGISEEASWHAKYKDSAYVYVGQLAYDLTEGDLLAVFAQYGEVVDVNLIRDKGTGKSKGFAFLAYEDQRSTNLAVDNLNGAQVLGRTIKVDHCSKYKKFEEEDEETRMKNREARGVCRAFQRGECTRGDSCKFSHDEKRAANTGWGHEEDRGDKFNGAKRGGGGGRGFVQRVNFRAESVETSYSVRSRDSFDRREPRRSGQLDDSVEKQSRKDNVDSDYGREEKRRSRSDYSSREREGSSRQSETSPRKDRDSSYRQHRERDDRRR